MTFSLRCTVYGAALAGALVLTGCGGSEPPSPDAPAGTDVAGAPSTGPRATPTETGGDREGGSPVEPQVGGGPGRDGLPEGFPVEKIPVVGGELVGGSRGKTDDPYAYTVLVKVKSASAAAAMEGVTALLTGAGFTVEPGPSTKKISSATFKSVGYDVGVNVIRAEGRTTVTYVVLQH